MKIDNLSVKPVTDGVDPGLEVYLRVSGESSAVLSLSGDLVCGGRLLAQLHLANREIDIHTLSVDTQKQLDITLRLVATLSDRAVSHLDEHHASSPKGDVALVVRVAAQMLRLTGRSMYLERSEYVQPPASASAREQANHKFTVLEWEQKRSGQGNTVVKEGDLGLLEIRGTTAAGNVTIPGSEWIHTFAPALGIGKFVVFELPTIDPLPARSAGGAMAEIVNPALKAMTEVQGSMARGDWEAVCESLRPISEILKEQSRLDQVKELLKSEGYPADALQAIESALKAHFSLASKFHHVLDQGQRVRPHVKPSREEAYLFSVTVLGLLNLIARKAHRAP